MRVVFFARKKKRTRTPVHMAQALEDLGHEVKTIRYGRWERLLGERVAGAVLGRLVRRFRPELLLVWKDCISRRLLGTVGEWCKTALVCVDWFPELPEAIHERARLVDLFLVTNAGQLEEFRRLGIQRPVFWPQAFDVGSYEPSGEPVPDPESEVAFIGKPGPPHRRELLALLGGHFEMKIWGREWEGLEDEYRGVQHCQVLPHQYARVCRASKVVVGCDAARGVELCFSNRLWLTLGCGGFLVTNYVPGFEELFENHRHLVWYESPEECVELIGDYLRRPGERERIAQAGRELVRERHTYRHRVQELVDLVGGLPGKEPTRGAP